MKRLRPLLLLLLLVVIAGGGFYYIKLMKKKRSQQPKPVPVTEASPLPIEQLEPSPSPRTAFGATPIPLPPTGMLGATPLPLGPPPATPMPGFPPPREGVPHAESLSTESQPVIQLTLGNPIRIAEGSTLDLEQVQVSYAGKAKLDYLWKVASGPEDRLEIQKPSDLKPRITIKNLEEPFEFILRLSVSDRQTEATADLKISAFPAKLQLVKKSGGAFVGVQHMGDKWVAGRGSTLEIFNAAMVPLAKAEVDYPITQFFATVDSSGQGAIFIQAPEGPWAVLQSDPVTGNKKSELPMLGKNIRRVVPFQMDGSPYMFALLERSIDLWNLSDPKHPRLKTSLGTFLKNPLYLTFAQRNLYVAEEDAIHLIDFSTGNLIASVPSGGSVTGLATFSADEKNYLLASIGRDRTKQGRKDYGLRVFQIGENGRLEGERRMPVGENLPVEKMTVISGPNMALLSVLTPQGWNLKLADLRQLKEVPLSPSSPLNFLALSEVETGRINGNPAAVVADGNQLRVLDFKAQGAPVSAYTVSEVSSFPTVLSAGWIQASADGTRLWVGDSGTPQGGALDLLEGLELKITKALNAPSGTFPAGGEFSLEGGVYPLLYLAEDLKSQDPKVAEGRLGFLVTDAKGGTEVSVSKGFLGVISPQGVLRATGIAARPVGDNLLIALALARLQGNLGGSGLLLLEKPKDQSPSAFAQSDLSKLQTLIPLQDARDVALSADGKTAFVAAGTAGLIAVDLEKKVPVGRMSLGSNEWFADRVTLGHQGNIVLASFLRPATRQVMVKIFGITKGNQMAEYGTIPDLPAMMTVAGPKSPRPALTQDDLYLFIPTQDRILTVFNLSNPAQPLPIVQTEVAGDIRAVAVANRFKDVFITMGQTGIAKLEFGF